MKIEIVSGPGAEPVGLDEAKLHCRIDITDDDELVQGLIIAARRTAEQFSNHKLITQTWDYWLDGFPGSADLVLPRSFAPVQSVTHVKYFDEDDQESTFDAANYVADLKQEPGRIRLKSGTSWPSTILRVANGVQVRVVVGYGDDADVPQELKQAMLLMIGHWYENRELAQEKRFEEIPFGARSLLWLDRNVPV